MANLLKLLNNKCMDLPGGNTSNGTPIVIWDQHGGTNQMWNLTADGCIESPMDTRKCLDIQGGNYNNGTPIILWEKHGGTNQKWKLEADGHLTSVLNPNKCIDVRGGLNNSGTPLVLWDKNNSDSQKWHWGFDSKSVLACHDRIVSGPPLPVRSELPKFPPVINSDGTLPTHTTITSALTGITAVFWSVGQTIRVKMLEGSAFVRSKVRFFAEKWMEHANIKFEFVDPAQPAEIRISFQPDGTSWSVLGREALWVPFDIPTMNFGWFTDKTSDLEFQRVVMHEFGHALGLVHEHQSPAGGIQWDRTKAYQYFKDTDKWDQATVDEQVFKRYSVRETNYSQYDPLSIMHYSIPAELTLNNVGTPWNYSLSPTDIRTIREWYPFPPKPGNASGLLHTNDDCDEIDFLVEYGVVDKNVIEFKLSGVPGVVFWWKSIEVPAGAGYIPLLSDKGSSMTILIPKAAIDTSRPIRFWKAKFLGIHTLLNYKWDILSALPGGCRLSLTWKRDHC